MASYPFSNHFMYPALSRRQAVATCWGSSSGRRTSGVRAGTCEPCRRAVASLPDLPRRRCPNPDRRLFSTEVGPTASRSFPLPARPYPRTRTPVPQDVLPLNLFRQRGHRDDIASQSRWPLWMPFAQYHCAPVLAAAGSRTVPTWVIRGVPWIARRSQRAEAVQARRLGNSRGSCCKSTWAMPPEP